MRVADLACASSMSGSVVVVEVGVVGVVVVAVVVVAVLFSLLVIICNLLFLCL